MQRGDHLARVARECVEDLAADGVVYAEVRYAPEQHLEQGLTLEQVIEAVNGVMFTALFPVTFLSSAFISAQSLPGPLRTIARGIRGPHTHTTERHAMLVSLRRMRHKRRTTLI